MRNAARSSSGGFSLVEITLALGIVTFSMLVIVGLLPVGLQSMQSSAEQYGMASITRQISSELQGMPFVATSGSYGLDKLYNPRSQTQYTEYYTRDGVVTTKSATNVNASPYFAATFLPSGTSAPKIPGATTDTYPTNLQVVKVTVTYPYKAPATSQQSNVMSFFVAR